MSKGFFDVLFPVVAVALQDAKQVSSHVMLLPNSHSYNIIAQGVHALAMLIHLTCDAAVRSAIVSRTICLQFLCDHLATVAQSIK